MTELERRWLELSDVPFDELEDGTLVLAEDWWLFPKGTDREDIWHYFDEHYPEGVYALLYEFPRERVVTCVNCKESYFVSDLRPVPVCWDDGKPIGWQYFCPDCVSDLEQNGILTRCECCGEVFYALDLQTDPETGEEELCPHCREVWCD